MSEEEFLRHTFQDFTHPDDLDLDLSHMHRLLEQMRLPSYNIEKSDISIKIGHQIWIYLSVTLVRDADGVPLCISFPRSRILQSGSDPWRSCCVSGSGWITF
jgi:PAS domain-containing protein